MITDQALVKSGTAVPLANCEAMAVKTPVAEPLSATALEGEVVLLSDHSPVALSMTADAALATAELLKAAGLAALEQQRYRRKDPNSGRLPRPGDED